MKQAAIYLRVSTDQQNYDRQKKELLAYCTRNQLQVKYIFEEKDSRMIGLSSRNYALYQKKIFR